MKNSTDNQALAIRRPTLQDASSIWRLVSDSGVLDVNSSYLYLLLCRDFAETCVVAERDGQVVGFVTGYHPPGRANVLFVWQVGVCKTARRQGLALRMLKVLVDQCDRSIDSVEATIAPSNQASRKLFQALARDLSTSFEEKEGFSEADFPPGDHEAEPTILVGPFAV